MVIPDDLESLSRDELAQISHREGVVFARKANVARIRQLLSAERDLQRNVTNEVSNAASPGHQAASDVQGDGPAETSYAGLTDPEDVHEGQRDAHGVHDVGESNEQSATGSRVRKFLAEYQHEDAATWRADLPLILSPEDIEAAPVRDKVAFIRAVRPRGLRNLTLTPGQPLETEYASWLTGIGHNRQRQ